MKKAVNINSNQENININNTNSENINTPLDIDKYITSQEKIIQLQSLGVDKLISKMKDINDIFKDTVTQTTTIEKGITEQEIKQINTKILTLDTKITIINNKLTILEKNINLLINKQK
ncbi:hypothetical protein [uncultured archaeal virus]|uniref:Uncharacterized protein n=1 Tax=uncultured archaeal virus TaxID=1960247 RepID=A0A8B0LSF4_9VIRU|nr:hypothetical protein [uncultured archaeal virus]